MSFINFRTIVTILASLCPFFAYICRLNLSLTIEHMVSKDADYDVLEQDATTKVGRSNFHVNEYQVKPLIETEDHTLSKIFFSNQLIYEERLTNKSENRSTKRKGSQKLRPRNNDKLKFPLIIEFDARDGKQTFPLVPNSTLYPNPPADVDTVIEPPDGGVKWNEKQRNTLLLAFFLGYVLFQIPSARVSEIFGSKLSFLVSGLGAAICSIGFPFAAKYSEGILLAGLVRAVMGASQSAMFPAAYVFISEWMPKDERAKWLPYPASFSRIGTIVMNLVAPPILFNYGWEAVFYVSGAAVLAWSLLFLVFGSSSPNESLWISENELLYIESHKETAVSELSKQASTITASEFSINEKPKKPGISWRRLITNRPVLVLSLVMFASEWSNMLLLIKLPGFLDRALKMELSEIGWWSSALVGIFCVQYPLSGYLALKLEQSDSNSLSPLQVRKLFEVVAELMQAAGCLMIAFFGDKTIVLAALLLMMLGRGTVGGGQCLVPPELSKDYTGTVYAFANTVANLAGVIGPESINWLVLRQEEHASWRPLWLVSAGIFVVSALVFCLFADNQCQNYGRKPKPEALGQPIRSLSEAQLTWDKEPGNLFKMEPFGRLASSAPKKRPEVASKQSKELQARAQTQDLSTLK